MPPNLRSGAGCLVPGSGGLLLLLSARDNRSASGKAILFFAARRYIPVPISPIKQRRGQNGASNSDHPPGSDFGSGRGSAPIGKKERAI